MKILLIIPGSGDAFYCGNCFRDYLYAKALQNGGDDVVVMPLYLPLTDQSFRAGTPLFFPATSFYIAQKLFKKGNMPPFVESILNAPPLLRMASKMSGATSAKGMEQMTLSMIQGGDKNFDTQVDKIINWIETHDRPDIIHLSTSMLIGIAEAIKKRIDIPVVCSLQDEEVWIDSLDKEHAQEAWRAIEERVCCIDQFITSSQYYKSVALNRIPLIGDIEVIYPGIDIEKYNSSTLPQEPVIGFFYHLNQKNGLDILAEAFVRVKSANRVKRLRLHIGGGFTSSDKKFLKGVRKTLAPYGDSVTWRHSYTLKEHADFYAQISAICVPITFEESAGLYLCEAFAAGRPAIEPHTGSFPEMVANGGILYSPNTPEALADAIEKLFTDEHYYAQCRANAQQLSQSRYNHTILYTHLHQVYSKSTAPLASPVNLPPL